MKKNIVIFLFLLQFSLGFSQSENVSIITLNELHQYEIENIDAYRTDHTLEAKNTTSETVYFQFYILEESELLDVSLEYRRGEKWRKTNVDASIIRSNVSYGSFFNGIRTFLIPIEANEHFLLKYSEKCKNSIFISRIDATGEHDSPLVQFDFKFPSDLVISASDGHNWKEPFQITQGNFQDKDEYLYLLVHPANSLKEQFFSNWFESRIEKLNQLDEDKVPAHLTQLSKTSSKTELAAACFAYVQQSIRYLDIENGINAIVPRDCNTVMTNKYGDCKDMANLLVALLKHFDFEAYNCISKTNSKEHIFNFPSLALANHMIAGLVLNDEWVFLDPTEKFCQYGDPSIQIFDTEFFAIGHPTTYFGKVPDRTKSSSEIQLKYELDLSNNTISSQIQFIGKPNTLLYSEKENAQLIDELAKRIFSFGIPLVSKKIEQDTSYLYFTGSIPSAFISELATKKILQTKFLADTKILFLLACYKQYPNYPLELIQTIEFKNIALDRLQTKGIFWNKSSNDHFLHMRQNWQKSASEKEFDQSEIWLNFKNEISKPIIISP